MTCLGILVPGYLGNVISYEYHVTSRRHQVAMSRGGDIIPENPFL